MWLFSPGTKHDLGQNVNISNNVVWEGLSVALCLVLIGKSWHANALKCLTQQLLYALNISMLALLL